MFSKPWNTATSQMQLRQAMRSDQGGVHAPPQHRGLAAEGEVPPGVTLANGHPTRASPFYQVHLPTNFKFEGRRSKSVSYVGSVAYEKGTLRTEAQARACVLGWAWGWWHSLESGDRSAIQEVGGNAVGPGKKRKRD